MSRLKSIPATNKAYYLLSHYPARRQYRVVLVHPSRPFEECWIHESIPKAVQYVETTYTPPAPEE